MRACGRVCLCACGRACVRAERASGRACGCACERPCVQLCVRACLPPCLPACARACVRACVRAAVRAAVRDSLSAICSAQCATTLRCFFCLHPLLCSRSPPPGRPLLWSVMCSTIYHRPLHNQPAFARPPSVPLLSGYAAHCPTLCSHLLRVHHALRLGVICSTPMRRQGLRFHYAAAAPR